MKKKEISAIVIILIFLCQSVVWSFPQQHMALRLPLGGLREIEEDPDIWVVQGAAYYLSEIMPGLKVKEEDALRIARVLIFEVERPPSEESYRKELDGELVKQLKAIHVRRPSVRDVRFAIISRIMKWRKIARLRKTFEDLSPRKPMEGQLGGRKEADLKYRAAVRNMEHENREIAIKGFIEALGIYWFRGVELKGLLPEIKYHLANLEDGLLTLEIALLLSEGTNVNILPEHPKHPNRLRNPVMEIPSDLVEGDFDSEAAVSAAEKLGWTASSLIKRDGKDNISTRPNPTHWIERARIQKDIWRYLEEGDLSSWEKAVDFVSERASLAQHFFETLDIHPKTRETLETEELMLMVRRAATGLITQYHKGEPVERQLRLDFGPSDSDSDL